MTPPVEPTDVICSAADLETYTTCVLEAVGLAPADAQYMAHQIVGSDLAGHESHGMRRLAEYVAQVQTGAAAPVTSCLGGMPPSSGLIPRCWRWFPRMSMQTTS